MMAGGYLTGPGDQIITEPLLGSLQDNGGPTLTQWIQNINIVCIVLGGPVLASFFIRMRTRGWRIDIPQQFAASLLLMALAFLILPLGIKLAGANGKSAFAWLFMSYVLQSIGELLILPIGYAMIGKLAPRQYQGVTDGQLDARDGPRVALCRRLLGHDS